MALIFEKNLTYTDVTSRLVIPIESFESFGEIPKGHHSVDFTAIDSDGHPWRFCLAIRQVGHPKPVLNGQAWLAFVRAKSLKIGDEITFSKEANEANEVILRIRARKIVRLFGRNIYEAV